MVSMDRTKVTLMIVGMVVSGIRGGDNDHEEDDDDIDVADEDDVVCDDDSDDDGGVDLIYIEEGEGRCSGSEDDVDDTDYSVRMTMTIMFAMLLTMLLTMMVVILVAIMMVMKGVMGRRRLHRQHGQLGQ